MYLKHLETSRGLAVIDQRHGALAFWASEETVRSLVKQGKVKAEGTKSCIRRLVWIGKQLSHARIPDHEMLGGHDIRSKTRYSHNHETEKNPEKVWALSMGGRDPAAGDISNKQWHYLQSIFLAVAMSCGGVRKILRKGKHT